jgi:hypothetical protein
MKPEAMLQLLKDAQAAAPSYVHIKDDGAALKCHECGEKDRKPQIKTFTPDGKNHFSIHVECCDEDWLSKAKDMGSI